MSSRVGFTLIEVVIAAFIFAVGVLALEATAAGALREMRRSSRITLAASLARSRMERLASTSCHTASSGVDTVEGVVSSWTAAAASESPSRIVDQTISYEIDGRSRSDLYRSAVPCR